MNNVEASDIYREVLHIKKDVESVKHQTSWLLRAEAESLAGHWERVFGLVKGKKRKYGWMRVFLETDGRRSVKEVAKAAGVYETDAGQWLAEMQKEKLVDLLPQKKKDKIYVKSPVDFSLGISERLSSEIETKSNGGGANGQSD
jgi:hypothetical protein